MYKTILASLFFLFSSTLLYAQSSTIPADVYEVKSFGHWEEGDKSGNYRIQIVDQGFEHVTSSVYLEWIRISMDGKEIIQSVPIIEINENFYSVSVKNVESDKLILSLTHTYSHEKSEIEIITAEPGKYKANE